MNRAKTSLGTGYLNVDSTVSCVLTRFQVRSIWSTIRFYLMYRRIRRGTRSITGLVTTLFLVENLRTCYTLSIWRNADAILTFNGSVHAHIDAANKSFSRMRFSNGRPLLWSAQFSLAAVSPCNLRWDNGAVDAVFREILGT
jgi:hypothetical protein